MSLWIRWLEELAQDSVGEAGGKAAHLGELAKAGFRVPEGFCILASAYAAFFAFNRLEETLHAALEPFGALPAPDLAARLRRFQELFIQGSFPPDLAAAIIGAYSALAQRCGRSSLPVAVRSSVATVDRARTSFPGQMDTYHNVVGPAQLLEAVKRCWASLWNFGAVVQRLAHGMDPKAVLIAPVVQRMVDADAAGVLFTIHPVTGRADEMVIDACLGLGEGVVSGRFPVDQFIVRKESGEVIRQEIALKETMIVGRGPDRQGTRCIPVATDRAGAPSLSSAQVAELARAGRALEEHFRAPQDIEWAFEAGTLYLLQSRTVSGPHVRPMGTAGVSDENPEEWVSEFDTPVDPRFPVYTGANISEVLPGVLTPLTRSGLEVLEHGFQAANMAFGIISEKDIEGRTFFFLGSFYGRAFLNLSVARELASRLPIATSAEIDRDHPSSAAPVRRGARDMLSPAKAFYLLRVLGRSAQRIRKMPEEAIACRKRVARRVEAYRRERQAREFSLAEYRELMDAARSEGRTVMRLHIEASQVAVLFYELLQKLAERWLGGDPRALTARLLTGLATVESAEPAFEIWELSRRVKRSPALREIFETCGDRQIDAAIRGHAGEEARLFKARLDAFLARYGYRSVFEAEVMLPSWEEDPSFVYSMIRNYLNQGDDQNPRTIRCRQEREREKALAEVLAGLPRPKRFLFERLLAKAQQFISLREFMKATLMMGVGQSKMVLRDISKRLADQGLIQDQGDIYFLTESEIAALIERGLPPEGSSLQEKIVRRKHEYERNRTVVLPECFEGRPKPLRRPGHGAVPVAKGTGVLKGIPLSPGKVRGRARVILDPRNGATIQPGEILVAPVTDAGWSPLFLTAAALVVDVGGLLSHGSIVAREYGIPGVINVKTGTSTIRNGQEILVDGDAGEVRLLD